MCPNLIVQEGGQLSSAQTRSQQNVFECNARIESKFRPRVDSYERCFAGQMGQVFGEVPPSVVEIGLQKGWRAAMKPGQRHLAPNIQISELKTGEYFVEKVVGVEVSNAGRRYKVVWQEYPGQDSWEREINMAGARGAVEDFWAALHEPMPESEVFRKNKRCRQKLVVAKQKKQKIVVDEKAAKRHKSELKKDLMFRG